MAANAVERLELMVDWLGSLAAWSGPAGSDLSTWAWDHSIQFGHRRDLYKLHDKAEAGGGFAGAFVSNQFMFAPLMKPAPFVEKGMSCLKMSRRKAARLAIRVT